MSFSQDPSCGVEVAKYGDSTLKSKRMGRCIFRLGLRLFPNPPVPSSEGVMSTPAAIASSNRRR